MSETPWDWPDVHSFAEAEAEFGFALAMWDGLRLSGVADRELEAMRVLRAHEALIAWASREAPA